MSDTEHWRTLRLSPEYLCYPTWLVSPQEDASDNPDPASLGLPDDLVQALNAWGDDFDAIFPEDDPGSAAFPSPEAELAFWKRGAELARAVKDAVGDRFNVQFHPDATRRTWTTVT